jgi:hypothetical protein
VKLGTGFVSVIVDSIIKDTTGLTRAGLVIRLTVLQQLPASLQVSIGGPAPTRGRQILAIVTSAVYFTVTKDQLPKALFFPSNALGFHAVPPLQRINSTRQAADLDGSKARNIPGIKYFNIANTL